MNDSSIKKEDSEDFIFPHFVVQYLKLMNFVPKLMDFILKVMDVTLNLMDFIPNMMGFIPKSMDFILKMMDCILRLMGVILKIMDFMLRLMGVILKMMDFIGRQPEHAVSRSSERPPLRKCNIYKYKRMIFKRKCEDFEQSSSVSPWFILRFAP